MTPQPLDVLAEPLKGMHLIEASAGTGKTHTLADLYLRLVLEGAYPVEHILVVTFTVAATAELRERIRARLDSARAACMSGEAAADHPVMAGLLTRVGDRAAAVRRLISALADFDQAAVLTIHGFCQRVLTEHAFESGQPFETELLPDESDLVQEVVDDFWRKQISGASSHLVSHLLEKKWSPESLAREIRPFLGKPYLAVLPPEAPAANGASDFESCYREVRALWAAERMLIESALAGASLHAGRYPQSKLAQWGEELDAFLRPEDPAGWLPTVKKFTAKSLRAAAKKGSVAPAHRFFEACERLENAREAHEKWLEYEARLLRLQLYRFVTRELAERKARRQVLAYQDQLVRLNRALAVHGPALADTLRNRYRAALIDEFQDTDPIQYAIFRTIYGASAAPVFLVGDPKQAIFGFRGADVFAYLDAGRDVAERRTLDRNWRSTPSLVRAVNALFGRARLPFLFPEIAFHPIVPAERLRRTLTIEGDDGPPFRVWRLPGGAGTQLTKADAGQAAIQATAGEIARLLALADGGRARIDGAPLTGGDIAVLVRTNRQAEEIRLALFAHGVSSVQLGEASVFQTPEAADLERLLIGIMEPEREDRLRAALATDLIGMSGNALDALGEDESAWEVRIAAFADDQAVWRDHGLLPMLRRLLRRERVAARLLALPDGERRLTNLLHLAELLQGTVAAERLSAEGAIRRLRDRRRNPGPDEAAQLRLASDENLVKIATIHKSKGLQYPIVFCPFLWDVSLRKAEDDFVLFHDPASGQATLDPGSSRVEEARAQADREALAENLRLAYVALTRAEHRATVVWGNINGGEQSGLAYLLHQPSEAADLMPAVRERAKRLTDADLRADLARLAAASEGTIAVETVPPPVAIAARRIAAEPMLQARAFTGHIPEGWRVTSFTGLAAGQREEADYDPWLRGDGRLQAQPASDIFGFPRGIRAGVFLHAVFAGIDFARSARADREAAVSRLMREHDFGPEWQPVISQMVENVLETLLHPAAPELCLAAIPGNRRLVELQFFYPIAGWDKQRLARLFSERGQMALGERIDALATDSIRGFMTGAIDLVFEREGRFYLADYKSNWLGADRDAYRTDRLAGEMAREGYALQSAIYMLALHRYLGQRVPGYDPAQHLGGAFYLFLRGMDPAQGPTYGVHYEQYDPAFLDQLDRMIGR